MGLSWWCVNVPYVRVGRQVGERKAVVGLGYRNQAMDPRSACSHTAHGRPRGSLIVQH
jgi:hypothetical protein